MRGAVSRYEPEEVCRLFVVENINEYPDHTFGNLWCATSQTTLYLRIMLIPKVNDTEYPIIYRKIVMDVPHESEIEIWSEICIEDNGIKEVIVFNDKKRIVAEKGFEPIMEKLKTNFENGLLDETDYDESVRILKGGRIRTIFK
ncbi:hypothetical protein [Bacillus sp. BNPI-92]|uniref:hypothetical protein n=1 Tax=Bacillus sp. BNPI-92 TaxID=2610899 RepID=UPI00123D1B32|nr:hypothetical protein [Bacillus sp. BNPI-92]